MFKIIKGFHILEKETGKMLKFTGSMVGKVSKELDKLGTEILDHLKAQKFIASHTQNDKGENSSDSITEKQPRK